MRALTSVNVASASIWISAIALNVGGCILPILLSRGALSSLSGTPSASVSLLLMSESTWYSAKLVRPS
ncbi:DUF1614 domain-containing protein [Moritella viscosa]|uniref:DUF1614 domain-containing protein n=1 Tax=Moritella viscosa TaxID=80854 RepID=UPI00349E5819